MSPTIAIDVAILPPQAVAQAALALSAALPADESQGLQLDDTHLPHITLTQLFVPREAIPEVRDTVAGVLTGRTPLELSISGPGRGAGSVWMQLALTPELRDLHRSLMDVLRPFEDTRGEPAAFVDDARPRDVQWVSGFRRDSSYTRYTPHVTLGHASALPAVDAITFTADTIAICHLGRFCSCRVVLSSWRLPIVR